MSRTAIVLGGTSAHISLLKRLKERGFRTVLVDYLEAPIAKAYADVHEQISTFDKEAVAEAARRHRADVVITASTDQVNTTACYVAEKLGLPKPYSHETALHMIDKAEMKQTMEAHGIPTTRYVCVGPDEDADVSSLRYPLMVKPVDNHGATGVKRANTPEELQAFLAEARGYSRSGNVVVEEFFEGTEISAYTIVKDGRATVVMMSERLSVSEGEAQVLKCYATVTPPRITETARRKIEVAATQIAEAFGLKNTPLHVQAFAQGDEISIIEFAARVAGGLSTDIIREHLGIDLVDLAIDSYLEQELRFDIRPQKQCFAVNLIYGRDGVFDHLEGVEELLARGEIEAFRPYRRQGSRISGEKANACRVAAYVTCGRNREELCQKARSTVEQIKVVDSNGNDITRHDLYLM